MSKKQPSVCKNCGTTLPAGAKSCPACGTKNSKPFYKTWWFWLIIVCLILGAGAGGNKDDSSAASSQAVSPAVSSQQTSSIVSEDTNSVSESEPVDESVPTEYRSALTKAKSYSELMHMSKAGIYNQLVSEYGEQFTAEEAQYAIDNIQADWNANALAKAQSYQDMMSMSPNAIYDQLVSEYGEQFTAEEAQYAIDNLS